LREHAESGRVVHEVFLARATVDSAAELVELVVAAGVDAHVVTDRVLDVIADTQHPQGVVAVCHQRRADLTAAVAAVPRLVVVLDAVADPGNAGTIIRTADAAGADAVIFAGPGVDPFGPKCVRASAGSVFHVPIAVADTVGDTLGLLRAAGLTVLAADPHAARSLDELGALLAQPTAWLFGHEVRGLGPNPPEPDQTIRIPMPGRAESLNLAAAAAICLFASAAAHAIPPKEPSAR
jgi:TrmH family RNA methyltransferase